MPTNNQSFRGSLLKPIHLGDAKARGLRAVFACPPDESDEIAHVVEQFDMKWPDFDKRFGLDSSRADIWEQRTKLFISRDLQIPLDDPHFYMRAAMKFAFRAIPGFSIKLPHEKRHGGQSEWPVQRMAQLFADIEFWRKKTKKNIREICNLLVRMPQYAERWADCGPANMCKIYSMTKKRLKKDLLFILEVCGPEATIPSNGIDPIEAAIKLHALKV
jgi:hypothetical protein